MRSNFNMEDPGAQEKIRRSSHEYRPELGKHGAYVEKPYMHQEYPKAMLTIAAPNREDFKGPSAGLDFETALKQWDMEVMASIVRSKAEENEWKASASAREATARKNAAKVAEEQRMAKLTAQAALMREFREAAEAMKELEKIGRQG